MPSNGIITLQDNSEYTSNEMHLHLASADLGQITIEQLPLYPGFILGDGVDDFAVTEKELNFEDTYTVYTAFIPFQNDPANTGNVVGSGGPLEVSSSDGRFGRIAFKNLAIYPRILSKDDCIKAYNYLQTLKAK